MIEAPRHPHDYPNRFLECQASLESALIGLIDAAKESGWYSAEITAAIISLADNYMLKQNSAIEFNAYIERLKKFKD